MPKTFISSFVYSFVLCYIAYLSVTKFSRWCGNLHLQNLFQNIHLNSDTNEKFSLMYRESAFDKASGRFTMNFLRVKAPCRIKLTNLDAAFLKLEM